LLGAPDAQARIGSLYNVSEIKWLPKVRGTKSNMAILEALPGGGDQLFLRTYCLRAYWLMLKTLLLLVFLFLPVQAGAATLTVGPIDCLAGTVNTAIASARDGDTVLLTCPGIVIWTSTVIIPNTKGITLSVQGGTNTPKASARFPLTVSSTANPILQVNCEDNNSLTRVTGFKFRNTIVSTSGAVFVQGRGKGKTGVGCFRIDNNFFDSIQLPQADLSGTITVWSSTGVMTGVIDNNTLYDSSYTDGYAISIQERWQSGGSGWPYAGQNAWTRTFAFGTSDFIFIEDNLFENISRYTRHFIAAIQGAKYVVRNNVFNTAKDNLGIQAEQVEAHGFCFCNSIGAGTRGGEIYRNTFQGAEVANSVLLRGGTWLVYDNTWLNPPSGEFIYLREYRAGSSGMCGQCDNTCPTDPTWSNCVTSASAYPMRGQISGTYVWNNLYLGINRVPKVDTAGVQALYIQANRDYFVSASRPAALSSYTPYTYPHPLRNAGSPPRSPQDLTVQ
jgi:hypothetical protein